VTELDPALLVTRAVNARGHATLWDYLKATPGVDLVDLAERLDGGPAVVLEGIAIEQAFARREAGLLVRDFAARGVRRSLPRGWKAASEHQRATDFGFRPQQQPYPALRRAMLHALEEQPPPDDWSPRGPDDEVLLRAYDTAFGSLSDFERALILRGESLPADGDIAGAAATLCEADIYGGGDVFLREFARTLPAVGHVFAARWCRSEVSNGGLEQLLENPTGVLVPEGAAGLLAIGMPKAAQALLQAQNLFWFGYPRDQERRRRALGRFWLGRGKLATLAKELGHRLWREGGGFDVAADAYAADHVFGDCWDVLQTRPGVPLAELVKERASPLSATAFGMLAVEQALARREAAAVVRDLVLRRLQVELPRGWTAGSALERSLVFSLAGLEREPYRSLLREMAERCANTATPDQPPNRPDDPWLIARYEQAFSTLPPEDQELVSRGERRSLPGERYQRAVKLDLGWMIALNHRRVPQKHRHVALNHELREKVLAVGFAKALELAIGRVLPECGEGLRALGMAKTADKLDEVAVSRGASDRDARLTVLTQDFLAVMASEAGGFDRAADAYVSAPDFPAPDDCVPQP
jgi:hypothetical protein